MSIPQPGTDLNIITSHGLGSLERGQPGGVTERIVRTAPLPVLTVKSHGRSVLPKMLTAGAVSNC